MTSAREGVPLCVDLDGTLLAADVLLESAVALVKKAPLRALSLPWWLLAGGRARLKREIASRVAVDAETLPLNAAFAGWLGAEAKKGRRLVLVTASDRLLAEPVAARLGWFSEVLASDGRRNLKGAEKERALVERFGPKGFDYAGDSAADLAVWRSARSAILVGASARVERAVRGLCEVERTFPGPSGGPRAVVEAIRPHQWAKNAIVFAPAVASHRILEPDVLWGALTAAVAFSLCASSVYVLNDLFDLPSDRRHPVKKDRPFASGRLRPALAPALIAALLAGAAALASLLPPLFGACLAVYYALTLAYTLRLRARPIVDVFTLAFLYTLRLLAGHAIGDIAYSPWLTAFALFLFLGLALMKRFVEFGREAATADGGRGYRPQDAALLKEMGISASFVSTLVLAFYVQSEKVASLYSVPEALWLLVVVALFTLSRLWFAAHRGEMDDDPVRHVLRDRVCLAAALLSAVILFAARRAS